MENFSEKRSTTLPLPSSPHCAPNTTMFPMFLLKTSHCTVRRWVKAVHLWVRMGWQAKAPAPLEQLAGPFQGSFDFLFVGQDRLKQVADSFKSIQYVADVELFRFKTPPHFGPGQRR